MELANIQGEGFASSAADSKVGSPVSPRSLLAGGGDAALVNLLRREDSEKVIHRSEGGILLTGLNSKPVKPTMAENEFLMNGERSYKPYGAPFQNSNAIFKASR